MTAGCSTHPASVSSLPFLTIAGAALIGLHWLITKLHRNVTTNTTKEDDMTDSLKTSNFRTLIFSTLSTIWAVGTSLVVGPLSA